MRLLVGGGDGATRVVELSVDRPGATIADLAEALGFDRTTALVVDGLPCDVRASIADIPFVDGCSVHPLGATPTSARSEAGYFWLGITNGPGTGLVHRTTAGTTVSFGRDPSNDLVIDNSSVSSRHGQLIIDDRGQVFVDDHASRNGTWIDGHPVDGRTPVSAEARIRVGSSTIRVCEIDPRARSLGAATHHADATGHIRWNRSPREPVAAEPAQVVVPNAAPVRESPKLAIAAVVAPLLFAGVMVVVLGSWRYALFWSPVAGHGDRELAHLAPTADQSISARSSGDDPCASRPRDGPRRRRIDRASAKTRLCPGHHRSPASHRAAGPRALGAAAPFPRCL